MSSKIVMLTGPDALAQEGLREQVEPWEDGLRTEIKPGTFEWWYFDARFEDGSTVVIVFFTKPMLERSAGLKPGVSIAITRPDGQKLEEMELIEPQEFSASKERCYVRAAESWVRGDADGYELHARVNGLTAHLNLTGIVPPWRPGAGKVYFDEARKRHFSWLAAVPYGSVSGYLTYDGKIHEVRGSCYHDHNWGNVGLNEVLSHWYWGRAHIGDYNLIFVEMTTAPRFGSLKMPVFLLAKGSQILTGDGSHLRAEELDFQADPGGRSYPTGLDFHWQNGAERIHLALREPRLIQSFSLLEGLPGWKRMLGGLFANPYYFRFESSLDLRLDLAGCQDRQQGSAIYEVMLLR